MNFSVLSPQIYGSFGGMRYLLSGTTGAGKTLFLSKLANMSVAKFINQLVGDGSSTLRRKIFVFSEEEEFKDVIRICAKPSSQTLDRNDFDDVIVDVIVSLSKQSIKDNAKHFDSAQDLLTKGFIYGDNHVAILGLLKDEGDVWISETAKFIEAIPSEELNELYYIAKSRMDESNQPIDVKKVKKTSIELKLAEVVREYLDGNLKFQKGEDIGENLAGQFNIANSNLAQLAYDFFNNSQLTQDGYLSIDIPLEESLLNEEMILKRNFFFSNNNSGNVSAEVLFEDIVVYMGINMGIVNKLGLYSKDFVNRNGKMEIGFIDTMGAFHKMEDKYETRNYFDNLFRDNECDGIILLQPLEHNANEKKFAQLSADFFRQFPYNLNLFIISNKTDVAVKQFISTWKLNNANSDPFADHSEEQQIQVNDELIANYLTSSIENVEKEVIKEIDENGNGRIKILGHTATSFMDNQIETYNISKLKNISQTIIFMLESLAKAKDKSEKIKVALDKDFGSDIKLSINTTALLTGIKSILRPAMFQNISSNCQENIAKVPHGQSFNALPLRLKSGEGYKVQLHERFIYVQSFQITFPGTIRNSLFSIQNDLFNLITNCVQLQGMIKADTEIENEILKKIATHLSFRNITASLVYEQTFRPMLQEANYSFGSKFQSYIRAVKKVLSNVDDVSAYFKALEEELHRSFKVTLDTNVLYKQQLS